MADEPHGRGRIRPGSAVRPASAAAAAVAAAAVLPQPPRR